MAADPVESSIGQYAQQPRLQLGRHVADLIQEQGAAFGLFEATSPQSLCPCEGATLVTAELRFQQILGHCGGIYCNEPLVLPRRVSLARSRPSVPRCSHIRRDSPTLPPC